MTKNKVITNPSNASLAWDMSHSHPSEPFLHQTAMISQARLSTFPIEPSELQQRRLSWYVGYSLSSEKRDLMHIHSCLTEIKFARHLNEAQI